MIQVMVTALCVYLSGWIIYCRFFHPLRSIPGPFLASFSRAWIVFKTTRGDMEQVQRALHKKHGYLVRIAHNEISCSDPEAIKIIYSTKNVFQKSDFYDAWAPPGNSYVGHFPARNEKEHSERRRIVNQVYSLSNVLESEDAIDACTVLFCEMMHDKARKKAVVDLALQTNLYAFDVLGELFFGKMFGFMKDGYDNKGYMKAINALLPAFTVGGLVPSYLTKLYLLSTIIASPSGRGAVGALQSIDEASKEEMDRRKKHLDGESYKRNDMLRKILDISRERGDALNFHDEHVQAESRASLFAGADTTSIALNSVLYYLMRSPGVYEKLTSEIDAAAKAGLLSTPVSYAEANKLPYLKACINEAMRLHPSVAFHLPRNVPKGGATISGVYIPEGYRIGINAAVVQYDQDVYGPDADKFNPDRWIEGDASRMEKTLIPFGYGARSCIGKNISTSEIFKLIPQVVRDFHLRLVDPSKEWTTENFWFNKQEGINVYFEERNLG